MLKESSEFYFESVVFVTTDREAYPQRLIHYPEGTGRKTLQECA